jgi:hypothetical protein
MIAWKPFLDRILTLNLVGTTVVFYVAARIYLWPYLHRLSPRSVMIPTLLLHSLRHLGMMFLTRGATNRGLPREFAWPGGVGRFDHGAAGIHVHFCCSARLETSATVGVGFQRLGHARLLVAMTLATVYRAPVFMGAAYWIPAFWVPSLLVTHYITFVGLTKHWKSKQ